MLLLPNTNVSELERMLWRCRRPPDTLNARWALHSLISLWCHASVIVDSSVLRIPSPNFVVATWRIKIPSPLVLCGGCSNASLCHRNYFLGNSLHHFLVKNDKPTAANLWRNVDIASSRTCSSHQLANYSHHFRSKKELFFLAGLAAKTLAWISHSHCIR